MPGHRAGERGAATVLVVAMAAVVLLVGCAVAGAVGLVVEHRRAQAAADLAALAAAQALQRGGDACREAAGLATRNGARLAGCEVHGAEVEVSTAVPGPEVVPWPVEVTGTARAGPAPAAYPATSPAP